MHVMSVRQNYLYSKYAVHIQIIIIVYISPSVRVNEYFAQMGYSASAVVLVVYNIFEIETQPIIIEREREKNLAMILTLINLINQFWAQFNLIQSIPIDILYILYSISIYWISIHKKRKKNCATHWNNSCVSSSRHLYRSYETLQFN